jgi:hypothetical protein
MWDKPRRGVEAFACLCAFGGFTPACSKGSHDSAAPTTSPRIMPGSYSATPPAEETPGASATPTSVPRTPDPFDYDGAPLSYTVREVVETSVVHVDPDQGVLEEARVAGASCFSGLTEGPDVRSAFIRVTVVPTEVGGPTEPDVLDCLRRVGDGLHFSEEGAKSDNGGTHNGGESIRSFSIDITLTLAH